MKDCSVKFGELEYETPTCQLHFIQVEHSIAAASPAAVTPVDGNNQVQDEWNDEGTVSQELLW
ncbi:hypothetical protein ACFSQ3_10210 [Sphingobacterium corticis]|uniref:Uncharacterized protein n=1 Tax=Sphingobacterium corticis TaxID=1812823 RepID=A0ABW5NM42_9SPHI